METAKEWYKSKTIWAALVTVIIGTLALVGVGDYEQEQESIVEAIMQVVSLVAGVIAIYGRIVAKDKINVQED